MKTCVALAASALFALLSIESTTAIRKYLEELPNGKTVAFQQALGHVGETSTPNEFGTLFSKSGKWDDALCKAKFPGTDMTVGEAFGDPCCTWKKDSGNPDFTVEPFTTAPKKTECAANKPAAAASVAPTSAPASSASPAPSSTSPAASKDKGKPSSQATGNATTPAPAGKTPSGNSKQPLPGSKCGVKKEAKSLEDDDSDDDQDVDY